MIQRKTQPEPNLDIMMPDVIRHLEPLNSLPDQMQKLIVNQSRVIPHNTGHIVFQQGDNDDFDFYLLEGEIQLECDGQIMKTLKAGSEEAKYRLAQLRPRQMTAQALSDVTLLCVSRSLLDSQLQKLNRERERDVEVCELEDQSDADWMSVLLSSPLFSRISAANIQMVFSRMEARPVTAGEVVICQGEPGDYYYIIKSGRCRVSRRSPVGRKDIVLAELEAGDSFGEEALIADAIRSASVIMETDGELMRLNREQFSELLMKPILKGLSETLARSRISEGAVWLDVRAVQAHEEQGLEDSINLPLPLVRAQHKRLDAELTYIAYCDDGAISAVAAFILINLGYDVCFLKNGLQALTQPDDSSSHPAVQAEQGAAQAHDTTVLADVRTATLETELSKANLRLQEAARLELQAEQTRSQAKKRAEEELRQQQEKLQEQEQRINESLSDAQQMKHELELAREQIERDMEEKLRLEREKIGQQNESARKMLEEANRIKQEIENSRLAAEQESSEAHHKVEQRILQIESQAERGLEQERQKLKEISDRNARELADIKRLKQESEARLIEERQAMSKTADENRQQMDEVLRMKEVMEAAQKAAQEEAEQKQQDQSRRMKEVVEAAQKAAREEAEQKQQDQSRHMKEVMEAAQKAAREEAEQKQQDQSRRMREVVEAAQQAAQEEAEQKRQDEVRRMKEAMEVAQKAAQDEAEQKHLEQVRRMKDLMETTQRAAQKEAEQQQLQRLQKEQALHRKMRDEVLVERNRLEQEFSKNSLLLEQAQQDKDAAEAARIAARQEAERLIEDYKRDHQLAYREQEQRLQEQREELEAEASRIQQMLMVSETTSRDAGLAVQQAEQDLERLKATGKLLEKQSAAGAVKQQLGKDVAAAEERINQASEQLRNARTVHAEAETAQQSNQDKMQGQQLEEDHLRHQLEADLQDWIDEQTLLANSDEQRALDLTQKQEMQRIRARAEQAHKDAKQHDLRLIEELSMGFDLEDD